jgi:hypothetical protein
VDDDLPSAKIAGLTEELAGLRTATAQLRAENARLLRLLELTRRQAAPPEPAQTGFFAALFAARADIDRPEAGNRPGLGSTDACG